MYPSRHNSAGSQQSITGKDVPATVRSLLTATKRLQDMLQRWSVQQASEDEVSDCYVQIGNEFNATINAFAQYDIHLHEVYAVPNDLRDVLENCLGEDPSPRALATYIPQVRRILFDLLQELQNKQPAYSAAAAAAGAASRAPLPDRR